MILFIIKLPKIGNSLQKTEKHKTKLNNQSRKGQTRQKLSALKNQTSLDMGLIHIVEKVNYPSLLCAKLGKYTYNEYVLPVITALQLSLTLKTRILRKI